MYLTWRSGNETAWRAEGPEVCDSRISSYVGKSVLDLRLVYLRSVTCYTDQNFKANAHFAALNLFTSKKKKKKGLTPSLPQYLMEFYKATLTFESADEILWCDHSNESSLPVLTHGAICFFKILENEMWKFGRTLPLATFGSGRVKEIYDIRQPWGLACWLRSSTF